MKYVTRIASVGADSYFTSPNLCLCKPSDLKLLVALNVAVERALAKHNGYIGIETYEPFRPRSTGWRSQNNRFYGHCEDIAEQVYPKLSPGAGKQRVHDGMLRMSVSEGYPTYLDLNGVETPLPSAEASMEQLGLVLRVQQRYADFHKLWLTEYIKEGPNKNKSYKSIGGRSYEEMMRSAPEFNTELGARLIEEDA